ncbi:hypothetical protein SPBR_08750 [Sporothrix brasiliensis 5110]|uniref:Uncharacterized protein n=1 Tax=Sporothrix brasiliensis 5110 TaxID=1398154 RepID=A0A0C2INP9_9PEZI|nr:uncharacterized protein SPBR_08750 [Sporothrix brasiliensis 5110]KIH86662.1 hypothetical protein SPBR_08750 [Sporothrix brasiliensis 5110]
MADMRSEKREGDDGGEVVILSVALSWSSLLGAWASASGPGLSFESAGPMAGPSTFVSSIVCKPSPLGLSVTVRTGCCAVRCISAGTGTHANFRLFPSPHLCSWRGRWVAKH